MVKLYIRAIKNGDMEISDVPVLWRGKVNAVLEMEEEEIKSLSEVE